MIHQRVISGILINKDRGSPGIRILGVWAAMVVVVLFVVSSALWAQGPAHSHSEDQSRKDFAVHNGEVVYRLVTVQEGDTLWQLVTQAALDVDPHILMERTLQYNNLQSTYLTAGQQIYIPCAKKNI
jgi:hypothetical protein